MSASTASPIHPVLGAALALFSAATGAATPGTLNGKTPCSAWTVAQVIRHAAGDQLGWAMAIAGTDGPPFDPFDPPAGTDDPAGLSDLTGLVATALRTADQVWATVPDDAASVPTPLPQGPMTADAAARACALDAAVHGWDVAVALGLPSPLTDELAGQLLPVAREFVEPLRQYGVFAEALPVAPGEGVAAQLLRYVGRDPLWTA